MESQKPKIAMYVKRPFGEKLNASFDFIKENWKQLFKYSTYLILPICLIQAANFSGLMGSMTDLTAMQAGIFAPLVGARIVRVGRIEEVMVIGDMLDNAISVADQCRVVVIRIPVEVMPESSRP